MKVGDLVQIIGSFRDDTPEWTAVLGTIIKKWSIPEWWVVLTPNGEIINWPEAQMTVINETSND